MSYLSFYPLIIGITIIFISLFSLIGFKLFRDTPNFRYILFFAFIIASYNLVTSVYYSNDTTGLALVWFKARMSLLALAVFSGTIYINRLLHVTRLRWEVINLVLLGIVLVLINLTDLLIPPEFRIRTIKSLGTTFLEVVAEPDLALVSVIYILGNVFYGSIALLLAYRRITRSSKVFTFFYLILFFAIINDLMVFARIYESLNIDWERVYLVEYVVSLMAIVLFISLSEFMHWVLRSLDRVNIKLKEEKKQIVELERIRHALVANINHEFKTPLNSVMGFANLLIDLRERLNEQMVTDYAKMILDSGKQLNERVEQVMYLARISSLGLEPELERIPVTHLEFHINSQFEAQSGDSDLRLEICNKDQTPHIITDWEMVRQIIYQLLSNAIKFSVRGRINVTIYRQNQYVIISISDEGIGMQEDQLNAIIEFFRQSDTNLNKQYYGLGLGLAITQRLAEFLDATLEVESDYGKGTTFRLLLPAYQQLDQPE